MRVCALLTSSFSAFSSAFSKRIRHGLGNVFAGFVTMRALAFLSNRSLVVCDAGVLAPFLEPAGGWPIETILRGTDRAGIMRQPIDVVKLKQMFTMRNEELQKLDEPMMIRVEVR